MDMILSKKQSVKNISDTTALEEPQKKYIVEDKRVENICGELRKSATAESTPENVRKRHHRRIKKEKPYKLEGDKTENI